MVICTIKCSLLKIVIKIKCNKVRHLERKKMNVKEKNINSTKSISAVFRLKIGHILSLKQFLIIDCVLMKCRSYICALCFVKLSSWSSITRGIRRNALPFGLRNSVVEPVKVGIVSANSCNSLNHWQKSKFNDTGFSLAQLRELRMIYLADADKSFF